MKFAAFEMSTPSTSCFGKIHSGDISVQSWGLMPFLDTSEQWGLIHTGTRLQDEHILRVRFGKGNFSPIQIVSISYNVLASSRSSPIVDSNSKSHPELI